MKTLGNKSLSAILLMFIRVVWWIEWIGAVIVLLVLSFTLFLKSDVSFNTPVTFSTVTIKNVPPISSNLPAGQLTATDGNFTLHVRSGFVNTLMMALVIAAVFAFIILITYQLKLIFSSFKNNDPFVESNTRRIRNIGFILIGYSLAQLLYNLALNQYLASHFKWEEGLRLTCGFSFSTLFIGVTMIVIAEIFRLGASLDNEQKLTI